MKHIKPLVLAIITITLSACSGNKTERPKLDYQSENHKIVHLDVPPDLRDPRNGDLYTLPKGTVASPNALQQERSNKVLAHVKNAHIERQGNQRWLVIEDKTAAEIWPLLRTFWQESGFTFYSEEPQAGLIETEWAENRAKLPNQGLRKLFDTVGLGSIYTTSERDKFLIRIERNNQDGVDVFFTHKGLKEVFDSKKQDSTVWQPRPNDPNLEAAFLARFMQYLGIDEATVQQEQSAQDGIQESKFAKREANTVLIYGSAERNINRIASALDRIGLTVQQFVSERGIFVVTPAESDSEELIKAVSKENKPGFFARLFGKNKAKETTETKPANQLFLALEDAGNGQRIFILDQQGQPYNGPYLEKWLNDLYRELH